MSEPVKKAGTNQTNFRIPTALKAAAKEKAARKGEDLTAVVIRALTRYVKSK